MGAAGSADNAVPCSRADHVQVRYRVDGQLSIIAELPKDMQRPVLSRIKLLADENIAESRFPQGGRFDTIVDNRPLDMRVSTLPTYWGRKRCCAC